MANLKPLIRRFAGPAIAAYLLHWGLWSLVMEAEQVILSALTRTLNWVADHFLGGFPRVETAFWSARLLVVEVCTWGFIPILLGLLLGWWLMHRKRRLQSPA